MHKQIKVHVVEYGRRNLYARFVHPTTGKAVAKTTGTSDHAKACEFAYQLQQELNDTQCGLLGPQVPWSQLEIEFLSKYGECVSGENYRTACKAIDRLGEWLRVTYVDEFTPRKLAHHVCRMETSGLSARTVNREVRAIYSLFQFCIKRQLLRNGDGPFYLVHESRTLTAIGTVYFILDEHTSRIKIGFTSKNDANGRMASLQTAQSTGDLVLLGTTPGTPANERQLHSKYASLRRNGEWFEASPELRHDIQQLTAQTKKV